MAFEWANCLLQAVRGHLERAHRAHAANRPMTLAAEGRRLANEREKRDALRARLRNIDAEVVAAAQPEAQPEVAQPEAQPEAARRDAAANRPMTLAAEGRRLANEREQRDAMRATLHEAAEAAVTQPNVEAGVAVVEGGPVLRGTPVEAAVVVVPRGRALRDNQWGAPNESLDVAKGFAVERQKQLQLAQLQCNTQLAEAVAKLRPWHNRSRWARSTSVEQAFEKLRVQEALDGARSSMLRFWRAIYEGATWAAASESRLRASVEVHLFEALRNATEAVEKANQDLFNAIQAAPSGVTPTTSGEQADEWVIQTVETKQAIARLGQVAIEAATRTAPPPDPWIYGVYQHHTDKLAKMAEPVPVQAVEWAREAECRMRERAYAIEAQEERLKRAAQERREEDDAARAAIAEQQDVQAFMARRETRQAAWERQAVDGHGVSCTVCWTESAQWAMVPCGHLCLCATCAKDPRVPHCPICRRKKEGTMRVFLN